MQAAFESLDVAPSPLSSLTNCCLVPEPPLPWLEPKLGFLLAACTFNPEPTLSELPLTVTLEVELVVLVAAVAPELVLLAKGLSTGPVATGSPLESGQHGPGEPLHLQQQRCKQQSVLVG